MSNTAITLRPVIREIMKMAADQPWTSKSLHIQARRISPGCSEVDVDAALTWNYGQGYVQRTKDHQMEQFVYRITPEGMNA